MANKIPIMKCGHAANAEFEGRLVCVICFGITENALIIDNAVDLEGRVAQCPYCMNVVPSDSNLPFFEYRKDLKYDKHYDGCRGWD